MFKFLKEKLKGAIAKISEGVEKEGKAEEKIVEEPLEEKEEEKGFFAKLKEKLIGKEKKEIIKTHKPLPKLPRGGRRKNARIRSQQGHPIPFDRLSQNDR